METSCSIRFIWPKHLNHFLLSLPFLHPINPTPQKKVQFKLSHKKFCCSKHPLLIDAWASSPPPPNKEAHLPVYILLTVPGCPFRKCQWPSCDRLRICFSNVNMTRFTIPMTISLSFPTAAAWRHILSDLSVSDWIASYAVEEYFCAGLLSPSCKAPGRGWWGHQTLGPDIFVSPKVPTMCTDLCLCKANIC